MPARADAEINPTHGPGPRRARGRPASTSLEVLAATALSLGLDAFTVPEVAERAGVAESTIYGYVAGREHLYQVAADSVFASFDVDLPADGWVSYVDQLAVRISALVAEHPGLGPYVLFGPYQPETIRVFEGSIAQVRSWLPQVDEHLAYVLVSRPVVLSVHHQGNPVFEPVVPWLRQAMLRGFEQLLADEPLPPGPGPDWRLELPTGVPPSR